MVDIHSHIIFGLDDGAKSLDESLRMISEAENLGIKVIIATPHVTDTMENSEKIMENYRKLVDKASDYAVTIKPGSEMLLNPFVCQIIEKNANMTLCGSRYILLELPVQTIPEYCNEIIYRLQVRGMIPIIAHPERNKNFTRNFDRLMAYIERGCLIQVDAASIAGFYGWTVKEFAKKLIKLNIVHFIASDAHSASDYMSWYKKACDKVHKWAGEEYTEKLYCRNAKIIMDNIQESIYEMI